MVWFMYNRKPSFSSGDKTEAAKTIFKIRFSRFSFLLVFNFIGFIKVIFYYFNRLITPKNLIF